MMRILSITLCFSLLSSTAMACEMHEGVAKKSKKHTHQEHVHATPALTGSSAEYAESMERMHRDMNIAYTNDADIDFARGMIPHHQGAVDMALTELKYGKDPKMRWLAAYILRWQQVEIAEMRQWLHARSADENMPPVSGDVTSTNAYKAAMEKMHHGMVIEYSGDADVDFARGMIPHHQAAIDMADTHIAYGKFPELRTISRNIIRSQAQEIALMEEWLKTQDNNAR